MILPGSPSCFPPRCTRKIIRSGYVPHNPMAMNRYGQQYYQAQMAYSQGTEQPIIEIDGKVRFGLPGIPLFPALGDDTILSQLCSGSCQRKNLDRCGLSSPM